MITLQSLITRVEENFLVSELGNEIVMMNTKTGDYIGLNEVSADIWKILSQPVRAEEIVNNLLHIYEVNKEDCENQTLECLNKMSAQGIVQYN